MPRMSRQFCLLCTITSSVVCDPKEYLIYFIRHADSSWNEHKDGTRIAPEIEAEIARLRGENPEAKNYKLKQDAEQIVQARICKTMEASPDPTADTAGGGIKRDVNLRADGAIATIRRGVSERIFGKFIDAGLSKRGVMQAMCLNKWIEKHCPAEPIGGDEEQDACHLRGRLDRERLVFVVSNLLRTRLTAMYGLGCIERQDELQFIALNFLQERGCNPDARPAQIKVKNRIAKLGGSAGKVQRDKTPPMAVGSLGSCSVQVAERIADMCEMAAETDERNAFKSFVDFVTTTTHPENPIFVVTGHSSWLMEFYRLKLRESEDSRQANDLEIKLTRGKLGNASVIKFTLAVDGERSWIVPDSTRLVYGYYKGGHGA